MQYANPECRSTIMREVDAMKIPSLNQMLSLKNIMTLKYKCKHLIKFIYRHQIFYREINFQQTSMLIYVIFAFSY